MIFPVVLTSLCSVNKSKQIEPFEYIDISPFYSNKETKVVVSTKRNYLKFNLYIRNDKYEDQQIISGEIFSPGTYIYSYSNSYTRTSNYVLLRYSIDGSNYVDGGIATRNITKAKYRTIENNESFSSTSTILRIKSDNSCVVRTIKYSFSGFEGLYVPSYYHKIQLDNFKILLSKDDIAFFNCTPTLFIKNYDGSFDGIDGSGENASFELKLIEQSYGYTFALAKDFFVDSETLNMYSQRHGLTTPKTKHIYLPINEKRNEDKFECYFQFNEFGIDRDMVFHHFELRSEKNIFGDCNSSKYCIVREEIWQIVSFILYFLLYS